MDLGSLVNALLPFLPALCALVGMYFFASFAGNTGGTGQEWWWYFLETVGMFSFLSAAGATFLLCVQHYGFSGVPWIGLGAIVAAFVGYGIGGALSGLRLPVVIH